MNAFRDIYEHELLALFALYVVVLYCIFVGKIYYALMNKTSFIIKDKNIEKAPVIFIIMMLLW